MSEAAEYHSKDFEWEDLRARVENDPVLRYHVLPFDSSTSSPPLPALSSQPVAEADSEAWKRFHVRHSSGRFFKERRYLLKEFPELGSCRQDSKLLEVGCGNGSTALPILRGNANISVYACDCSNETLSRSKEVINAAAVEFVDRRFHPFQCDICTGGLPLWLACYHCRDSFLKKPANCSSDVKEDQQCHYDGPFMGEDDCCIGGVDFITLIFTLSAVTFQRMPAAIKECFSVLKPGGLLLFRDYGLYDMTMLRFSPEQRVGFREYMRLDGTRSYFFCLDTVRDLFVSAGFIEIELEYCCVKSLNRQSGKVMQRVWVHGKFQKPN